jgi:hypothetical protein
VNKLFAKGCSSNPHVWAISVAEPGRSSAQVIIFKGSRSASYASATCRRRGCVEHLQLTGGQEWGHKKSLSLHQQNVFSNAKN